MQNNKIPKLVLFGGISTYLFLYIPLMVVIVFSFNESRLGVEFTGFTFKWYKVLWQDDMMINAAINSLIIAFTSSFISIILGTLAGVALYRYKIRFLSFLVFFPIAAPELVVGVALLNFSLNYI